MNYASIITEFERQYGHLKGFGLKIHGVGNLIADHNVISISTPFIFDRTKLPEKFMGLDLRDGIPENDMPPEFRNIASDKEYIWAYQRFEEYVDRHANHIRQTLDNSIMTRKQMLDSLCFGDFEKHKEMCIKWENEGTIPTWTKKGSRSGTT